MCEILTTTQANGNLVRDAIVATLTGKSIYEKLINVLPGDVDWNVLCDVRFNVAAEATAWYTDIQAKWSAGGLAGRFKVGSRVSIHNCPHDDKSSNYHCREHALSVYSEKVK